MPHSIVEPISQTPLVHQSNTGIAIATTAPAKASQAGPQTRIRTSRHHFAGLSGMDRGFADSNHGNAQEIHSRNSTPHNGVNHIATEINQLTSCIRISTWDGKMSAICSKSMGSRATASISTGGSTLDHL